jgi:F-type H+-transporting ATPase subunit delta
MSSTGVISRRKLAAFIADELASGNGEEAIRQAAAYLIETGQTKSAGLLARDIEEALSSHGVVVADITTARPLDKEMKTAVASMLNAKELHARETVDETVLGGVRVEVAGKRYDGTLRHKIDLLKAVNTKKGVK